MFKKIAAFFHRHPGIKTTVIGGLGAAASAGASGVFGPKVAAVVGAATAVAGLWTKRPKDATAEDKSGDAAPPAPPASTSQGLISLGLGK